MPGTIPINPSYGRPKAPWDKGGRDPGPIVSPPDIGVIGGPDKAKFANRNPRGNRVMKVGQR